MASDSSASTTPLILTPDSTGSAGIPDSLVTAKKARRQTAFYPNVNSSNKPLKPFSRSAAKRESVMALGSIEHLQHYFTKTGIAAKKTTLNKPHHGLVPAIGGISHVRTNPSLGNLEEFNLPPSPSIPTPARPAFPPFVKTYETDPESLLPGVVDDLTAVAQVWRIDQDADRDTGQSHNPGLLAVDANTTRTGTNSTFDVLGVLKTTTRAIRSIRNYLLSLPDESTGTIRAQFRSKSLGLNTHKLTNTTSTSSSQPDPLTLIRRSALEVLTVLRELEEKCRLPLSDAAYDAQSDGGASRAGSRPSSMASPSNISVELPLEDEVEGVHEVDADSSVTFVQVQGRYKSVPVWEDDETLFGLEDEDQEEKRDHWDDRLVLGSGWLYRQDVKVDELGKERGVVGQYLDVVDEVLFGGKKDAKMERGWERERRKVVEKEGREGLRAKGRRVSAGDSEGRGLKVFLAAGDGGKRRVSTGMVDITKGLRLSEEPGEMAGIDEDIEEEEDSVDDEELPEWARRSAFVDDDLSRAHAIIFTFLPAHLVPALASASPRAPFLASLSSGQLLCVAYNACVRKSKKPWGYVSKDGIHDILALEKAEKEGDGDGKGDGGKKGWTFRRTDNLRLWAGALKIRYLLPIQVPSRSLNQPGAGSGSNNNTPLNSPTLQRFPSAELPILFDAKVVARKDDGWEDMLEGVLKRWVGKVVEERRAER